jgi:hypothetical protein
MVDWRVTYKALSDRTGGKRPRGRSRCRWEDNIKMCSRNVMGAWVGLIWLRTEAIGGSLMQGVIFLTN